MDSKYAIGIDLGTTYCSVAVFQNGKVKVLEDEHGNRRIPSYVAFTDNECLVGSPAKSHASVDPSNTVYGFKRLLGRKFHDTVVTSNKKHWPFSIIDEKGRPKIEVQYKKAQISFFPEEITAMLLTKMKEMAEAHFGTSVSQAVISVPANFNYLQRMATVDAANIAGLEVSRLFNEPTAAALAYFVEKKITGTHNLMVFALGGGSFDVSIVSIRNGILQVKAVSGDTHLGGDDFDNKLFCYISNKFEVFEPSDITQKRLLARLKNSCEKAKKDLSKLPETSVEVEGCDYSCAVNREEFIKCTEELYRIMMGHVNKVLQHVRSNKVLQDTDNVEVLLIGGSTRIPHIEKLLNSMFKGVRATKSINCDEAVMCGAAVQAALLQGDKSDAIIHLVEVQDITARSLYIRPKYKILDCGIPAYSKIPCSSTVTFQAKLQTINLLDYSICEMSNNAQKDILESFMVIINDSNRTPQAGVDFGVRVYITDNGMLTLEGLNATVTYKKNFEEEDIKNMQQSAMNIKMDCKKHRELMQCRNNLEGCIISIQTEFESMCKNPSKICNIITECEANLKWMSNNEGATKVDYERKQKKLQSLRKTTLKALHSKTATLNSVSSVNHTEAQPARGFQNVIIEMPALLSNLPQHADSSSDSSCDTINSEISLSNDEEQNSPMGNITEEDEEL